ncbi:hypothetical protein [Paenibacillus sp. NFR01]|uniref:hypothetical protein n=1 Tax=Paenibacillus sp. NFR01 TaxID=1566279 RepID=UPI0008B4BAA4|nr:hypothetical protein [Paenibacillus sp. NFR01]SET99405.1 hypothetical protein SAMN03159358_3010 [Paenibacillus sp. NFR01]
MKKMVVKWLRLALLPVALVLAIPAPQAHANYINDLYNGFKTFSELPDEVNQLQDSYRQAAEELEKTKSELGETADQLDETRDQLGQAMDQMEAYRTENASLQEQNKQLSLAVEEMKQERTARESYFKKIKVTVITGLCLLFGYFLLIRLLRFGMRRRSGRQDRLR